jgi:hypothetical protein
MWRTSLLFRVSLGRPPIRTTWLPVHTSKLPAPHRGLKTLPWRGAVLPIGYRSPPMQVSAHLGLFLHAMVSLPRNYLQEEEETEDFEPTTLEDYELAELYSGRFPTNFGGDFIHLRHLSGSEIRQILNAFEKNKEKSV